MNENEQRTHTTVLLEQAVAALNVKNSGTYVDGTFGRGGHSRAILGQLAAQGRLYAFDRDAAAVQACEIKDERFELIHAPFASMQAALHSRQVEAVDGVLLDLGVSSPQLDDGARGFSFRFDGPLDMRMDTSCGMSAEQWLNSADEKQIGEVIRNYGEERFAKQIARAIVAARERGPIQRTSELAQIVGNTVRTREPGQHPATRSFQAIRIFINQELEELQVVLPQCVHLLRAEGRLVVISFHSLEDRIVKRFMQHEAKADHLPEKLPVRAKDVNQAKLKLIGRACKPDYAEVANNARARSAVMRVAEKLPHRVAA